MVSLRPGAQAEMQNGRVSSPPVTLLEGLSELSNSSKELCFSLIVHKAVPAKTAQPDDNVASTPQGKGGNEKNPAILSPQGARKLYSPSDLQGMLWDCSCQCSVIPELCEQPETQTSHLLPCISPPDFPGPTQGHEESDGHSEPAAGSMQFPGI